RRRGRAAVFGRNLLAASPPSVFVATFGPPGFAVQRAELSDHVRISQHDEPPWLPAATAGRLDRRLQDHTQVVHGNRIGSEATNRALAEHRFAEGHLEAARINVHSCAGYIATCSRRAPATVKLLRGSFKRVGR